MSTAATRWWCHSSMRHRLTGYGPTATQSRLIRYRVRRDADRAPSAGEMRARAAAIDQVLGANDRESGAAARHGS
ncbi:MAG: hypothetical protein ACRDNO_04340 [Trebonia sp.]